MNDVTLNHLLGMVSLFSLVIQRLIELVDEPLDRLTRAWVGASADSARFIARKKTLASLAAITLGVLVSSLGGLELLKAAGYGPGGLVDYLISGLAIGSGTEGVNSILKYASYAKARQEAVIKALARDPSAALQPDPTRKPTRPEG